MLGNDMLHDFIVTMGINANVWIMRETKVHDVAEYAVDIRVTGYSVNDMIRQFVIQPLAFMDLADTQPYHIF
jgi:hypothetical protein